MCGRYTFTWDRTEFEREFELELPFDWEPRYNIAPTQDAPIIALRDGARAARLARWGLVPSWADDPSIGNRMINARAETVASKPAFRAAFKRRRCLVPADGWYEWTGEAGRKQPHWIHREDGEPMAFAGLWEVWGDEPLVSYTILTRAAAPVLKAVHHRMPVVLTVDGWDEWLVGPSEADGGLLGTADGFDILDIRPVSRVVNSPGNEGAECIEEVR